MATNYGFYRYDWIYIILEKGKEAVYWFWLDDSHPKIMMILKGDGQVEIAEQWFEQGPYKDDRLTLSLKSPNV